VPLGEAPDAPVKFWSISSSGAAHEYQNKDYAPWDEKTAYRHSVIMGNNGIALQRLYDTENAVASLERVLFREPLGWSMRPLRLMLYAHGGLTDEDASVRLLRILAPYFAANGIYPIFFTWKTGVWESIKDILRDHLGKLLPPESVGMWDRIKDTAQEAKDRLIEAACQELHIKAI